VGSEAVGLLAAAGHRVRAVARQTPTTAPPENVAWMEADVATPDGAARAVAGAGVVISFAQPAYHRWPQEFPGLMRTIADACTAVDAPLVMADNLYCYGPHAGPLTEDLPMAATTRKGSTRAAVARDLLERHARGDLRVTLGRASDYFGPTGNSIANALVLDPVRKGKRGRWVGRLDRLHTHSYSRDFARALIALSHDDRAFGRPWHLPAAPPLTGGDFVRLTHRVAGIDAEPGLVTPTMSRVAGLFVRAIREGNEMAYEFTEEFVVDHTAFDATFGPFAVTPLADALAESLALPAG
jgi:nucleoside-diphosphate-sugar epimerase